MNTKLTVSMKRTKSSKKQPDQPYKPTAKDYRDFKALINRTLYPIVETITMSQFMEGAVECQKDLGCNWRKFGEFFSEGMILAAWLQQRENGKMELLQTVKTPEPEPLKVPDNWPKCYVKDCGLDSVVWPGKNSTTKPHCCDHRQLRWDESDDE